jgi:hypothetical protein
MINFSNLGSSLLRLNCNYAEFIQENANRPQLANDRRWRVSLSGRGLD